MSFPTVPNGKTTDSRGCIDKYDRYSWRDWFTKIKIWGEKMMTLKVPPGLHIVSYPKPFVMVRNTPTTTTRWVLGNDLFMLSNLPQRNGPSNTVEGVFVRHRRLTTPMGSYRGNGVLFWLRQHVNYKVSRVSWPTSSEVDSGVRTNQRRGGVRRGKRGERGYLGEVLSGRAHDEDYLDLSLLWEGNTPTTVALGEPFRIRKRGSTPLRCFPPTPLSSAQILRTNLGMIPSLLSGLTSNISNVPKGVIPSWSKFRCGHGWNKRTKV